MSAQAPAEPAGPLPQVAADVQDQVPDAVQRIGRSIPNLLFPELL